MAEAKCASGEPPSSLRALYVGDPEAARRRVAGALREEGIACSPLCVTTPAELVEALRAEQPWEVLIGEHAFAGLGFVQALRMLAARGLELPAILLDGQIGEEAVADALQAGAAAYVSTSEPARLGAAIKRLLSSRAEGGGTPAPAGAGHGIAGSLLDAAPDAMVVIDDGGLIVLANRQAQALFGYELDEVLGAPVELLLPEHMRAAHVQHRVAYLSDPAGRGMGVERELKARTKDGRELPVSITLSPVHTSAGTLVAAAVRDSSARTAAQEALRLAEERFRRAFEEAPIGMALVGLHGRCLSANRALCEIVGYTEQELRGLSFREITHPEDIGSEHESIRRVFRGEIRGYQLIKRYLHKDGRPIWVDVSVSLVRDGADRPLHYIAQVHDVSAARDAQESLRVANARLRAVFDHAPAGMLLRSVDGEVLQANAMANEHLSMRLFRADGYAGEHREATVADQVNALDDQVRLTRSPVSVDMTIERPDGGDGFLHVVRYPVVGDDGEVTAVGSFAVDITDRKLAEQAREKALHDLEDAQRVAAIGSWFADPSAAVLTWSTEMYRILGRDPRRGPASQAELLDGYVAPEDRERVRVAYLAAARGERTELDYRVRAGDGTIKTLHALTREDPSGPGCIVGTVQDVSAQRAAAAQLRAAEERFRGAFESAPIGMALCALDGTFTQVNGALCEITGYSREALLSTSVAALMHADDAGEDESMFRCLLAGEIDHVSREQRYVRSSGDVVWVSQFATVLRDRDGRPLELLLQILDVTDRRMLETQLRHLADHDPLTGLLNRRGLEAALEQHVARVSRYGDHGALIVMDLDHFKSVNDTLGHSVGDELIVSIGALLTRRLRASDTIARLGGDEFAILLPEADLQAAEKVAEKIVKDVRENAVLLDGRRAGRVTASIGVTLFEQGKASADEALVNADLAMYDAKEAGRDRAVMYSADRHDQSKMQARVEWIDRIRTAIHEDRFLFYAQPIADLASGAVCHYELLLRMRDEHSGECVLPGAFLHIAERYDLVQELDRWVTRQAIALLERQRALGNELTLEINLSAKSLGDGELLELIERELRRTGVPPAAVIFEVTETAAVANIQVAREFAERLSRLGCRFALDDFGAGFDSFYYLKYLPFDFLKIDGEFVVNCTRNRTDQLVIESLVSVARGLGKRTIAEFVEDAETIAFLRAHGVDFAQGYHIGRPVPVGQLLVPSAVA